MMNDSFSTDTSPAISNKISRSQSFNQKNSNIQKENQEKVQLQLANLIKQANSKKGILTIGSIALFLVNLLFTESLCFIESVCLETDNTTISSKVSGAIIPISILTAILSVVSYKSSGKYWKILHCLGYFFGLAGLVLFGCSLFVYSESNDFDVEEKQNQWELLENDRKDFFDNNIEEMLSSYKHNMIISAIYSFITGVVYIIISFFIFDLTNFIQRIPNRKWLLVNPKDKLSSGQLLKLELFSLEKNPKLKRH